MADTLIFDPATEFEIIETFDFDEEVQRPEELRFFTLDEQLLNYFDKVLPKKKNITEFEYKQISNDVDRIRKLYNKIITITDSNYEINLARKSINVPWIYPIYEPFQYNKYSFKDSWLPFYDENTVRQPNYYPRMMTALPSPYKTTSVGGVGIEGNTIAVDEDGKHTIHAQGIYSRTKRVLHEDGTYDIVSFPIQNTDDDIHLRGYFLKERGVEIPNPLPNHPFFETNKESKLITNEKLSDIFPHIDAIIEHGVPLTTEPYTEGLKYLKIYDVKLDQIPWNLWKSKFPSEDMITTSPPITSISFPAPYETTEPSKSLKETYVNKWTGGIDPRLWLMKQEDGGRFVIKMLLSRAGDNGRTPPEAPGEKPVPSFPQSTPEECFVDGDFDAFLNAGVYRPPGVCVPASYIAQERAFFKMEGKRGWVDTTANDILIEEQKLLKLFQSNPLKEVEVKYEKYITRPPSDLRKQVIALLQDDHRTPADKADAIRKIVREILPQNEVYLDNSGLFVVCNHTLSELNGDMETDKILYYINWTEIEEGFRVCRYCGEQVNTDVFIAQDEYDDDGHLIISHEKLPVNSFPGDSHNSSFTTSLKELQKMFNFSNVGEYIFYLILSILKILPEENQVIPLRDNIRKLTKVIDKNQKLSKTVKNKLNGIIGMTHCIILLQTHTPRLVPARSFGTTSLNFSGYPRDTDNTDNSPILDTLITILKIPAELLTSSLKSPVASFFREILKDPESIRKESISNMKLFVQKFKDILETAKNNYGSTEVEMTGVPLIIRKKQFLEIGERIGKEETVSECNVPQPKTVIIPKSKPNIVQEKIELQKNITAFPNLIKLDNDFKIPLSVTLTEKDVQNKKKLGIPNEFREFTRLNNFLKSNTDFVTYSLFLTRLLDILSINKFSIESLKKYRTELVYLNNKINNSLKRDAIIGIIYEVLHEVSRLNIKSEFLRNIKDLIDTDLIIKTILTKKEDAEKEVYTLKSKERELFKMRMRQLNDTQREATKFLLDIGISSYIVTNEDRELFQQEYVFPDPEEEYDNLTQNRGDGFPVDNNGDELENDRGEHGDKVERANNDYDYTPTDETEDY